MSRAVFPPCCFAWVQTMVGIIVVMATSFKRTYASTILFSSPDSMIGSCWPTPPPETPGHSQASLTLSLWGHCSFLLGAGAHRFFFFFLMPSKSLFPQSLFLGLLLCPWMWGIFFRWDPTFSCQWLVSSKLEFWSSYRKRWVHVLLLHQEPNYLFLYPKTHIGKAMVFTSHVWMWELDHKQGWALNNWCFQTVVL